MPIPTADAVRDEHSQYTHNRPRYLRVKSARAQSTSLQLYPKFRNHRLPVYSIFFILTFINNKSKQIVFPKNFFLVLAYTVDLFTKYGIIIKYGIVIFKHIQKSKT
jgi:hypothetical protein